MPPVRPRPGTAPRPEHPAPPDISRTAALAALGALGALLIVALLLVVPWELRSGGTAVDVGRDFAAADVAREAAFHSALRPSSLTSLFLGLLVAAALGLTPLGARLIRRAARPLGGGRLAQVVLAPLVLAVVGRLATLPLSLRSEQLLRDYGLSTRSWPSWAVDVLKGLAVSSATTAIALLAVFWVVRWSPRHWWAWSAGLAAALVVLGSFAYPVLVEPVFNSFTSLPQGPLRAELLGLAARDGQQVDDVLVADASRRTSALNAYVSGFGSSRRIVVYDTLLRAAPSREVALIAAHELGHAKRLDVLTGTLLGALGAAAGVCALALLLSWRALLRRAGAAGPADPAVIPLVLLLVAVGSLLSAPVVSAASRAVETRADLHSLQLTGDVDTFVAVERRLALTNLSDLEPDPLLYAWFATHPSAPERIAFARAWQR